jgi:hypothetical protein
MRTVVVEQKDKETGKLIKKDTKIFKDFMAALKYVTGLYDQQLKGKLSYTIGSIDMSEDTTD